MLTKLGFVGPAQSEYLYHFTDRNGDSPSWVPPAIQQMSGPARLDAILREEKVLAFPPFGVGQAGTPCVCLSESTPEHLAHLVAMRQFGPWGFVISRTAANMAGGGTVAYVPTKVYDTFKARDLAHWAVRTDEGSTWMHEREWRVPAPLGAVRITGLDAILIGRADWRPSKVPTEWVDPDTSQPLEFGPGEHPNAVPVAEDYPRLWRESAVWVWDQGGRQVVKYKAGELC